MSPVIAYKLRKHTADHGTLKSAVAKAETQIRSLKMVAKGYYLKEVFGDSYSKYLLFRHESKRLMLTGSNLGTEL